MTLCNSSHLSWLQLRRQNQVLTTMKKKWKVSNALSHLSWHGLCQQLHNLEIALFSYWFQIPSISEFWYWFWIPSIFYLNFPINSIFHQYLSFHINFKFHQYLSFPIDSKLHQYWVFVLTLNVINILSESFLPWIIYKTIYFQESQFHMGYQIKFPLYLPSCLCNIPYIQKPPVTTILTKFSPNIQKVFPNLQKVFLDPTHWILFSDMNIYFLGQNQASDFLYNVRTLSI